MTEYQLNYILNALKCYLAELAERKDFSSFEYEQCLIAVRAVEKLQMMFPKFKGEWK